MQTKQLHVIPHTLFPRLPTPAPTPRPLHHQPSANRHPIINTRSIEGLLLSSLRESGWNGCLLKSRLQIFHCNKYYSLKPLSGLGFTNLAMAFRYEFLSKNLAESEKVSLEINFGSLERM